MFEHFFQCPYCWEEISMLLDSSLVKTEYVEDLKDFMFCPFDIKEEEMADAIGVFKGEVPDIYFEDGTWSLNDASVSRQVYDLMRFLIILPEFQLK